ncbi:uncharacterized protein LOC100272462 precursor [Zea mays]|jgi:hypothetical protein|uniref:Anther-specific protein BCP1 n=1 Tax=Zea mays TaxID=4577 RepID=B4FNS4_MAIZE|nr:uncharacterized protein LOC100272462 precursor [Zea mays]ACF83767.1 unknown [Zea mays]ONM11522.1 hypothetical protein ZEAMMB73_Zm00001d034822 [Zea mays]|eukprot:NP_001140407.1 uncharacterized protein LOC100272462 precursor [Zea mays]
MASHRALLLLLLAAALVAALASVASADDANAMPTILTPVAHTPLGSFDGDKPASDEDAVDDDEDAAPVGAPNGATMTEPRDDVPAPPGAEATAGGAAASNAPVALASAAARVCAAAAVAAGAFASF